MRRSRRVVGRMIQHGTTLTTIRRAKGQALLDRFLVVCTCGWGLVVQDETQQHRRANEHLKSVDEPKKHCVIPGKEMGVWNDIEETEEE